MKVDTVAALKRIPPGTKLYLVRTLMGPQPPSLRTVVKAGARDLQLRIDDTAHKSFGRVSYLGFPSGTKIQATPNGFIVFEPVATEEDLRLNPRYPGGEIGAEYVFAE